MQFPEQKIEAAIGKEESRYALRAVYFDADKKRVIATNGHILALVPCTVEHGDVSGLIPMRGIELARAATKRVPTHESRRSASVRILKNKKISVKNSHDGEEATMDGMTGQFPNWNSVIPEWASGKPTVCLSIGYLKNLLDALSDGTSRSDGLCFWIKDGNTQVMVAPVDRVNNGFGVIMPIRAEITASEVFTKTGWEFPAKPKETPIKPEKSAKKKTA